MISCYSKTCHRLMYTPPKYHSVLSQRKTNHSWMFGFEHLELVCG